MPIVFHNLSGYDAHLFIRELQKKFDSRSICVIIENKNKFMVSSLDSFYRNLVEVNGKVCKKCRSKVELTCIDENYVAHGTCGKCKSCKLEIDLIFDNLRVSHMDEQSKLLLRKGVYPYEYVNDCEKFKENYLPPTEAF